MGGKYYKDSGKNGEIPGLDVKSKPVMIGFDVEAQKPIMDTAQQIYIDGLPVSGREAAAFINEKSEGMEGQGGVSVPDALMAAQQRRTREMSGRDYLGGNMFRTTAEEELQRAQKAAGTNALLKRLQEYNGKTVALEATDFKKNRQKKSPLSGLFFYLMDRFVRLPLKDSVTHDVHPSTLGPGLITNLSTMALLSVTVMMKVDF